MNLNALELSRRSVLKSLGGGILIFVGCRPASSRTEKTQRGGRGGGGQTPQEISAWLHIAPNSEVSVFTGKVEVGQNIRTSLAQAVADELHIGFERVRMVMGDTDRCPFDMGTFGSRTTPSMAPQLKRAAAAAREALLDLAAEELKVDRESLVCRDGQVVSGSKSVTYGELASKMPAGRAIPSGIEIKSPRDWTVLGTAVRKVNGREIVTGRHAYSADQVRPGMLHAKVLRAPAYGAELAKLNVAEAEKRPGVKVVRDGDFVAVAAPSLREAEAALFEVSAEWKTSAQPSNADLPRLLRGEASPPAGDGFQATYTAAYIAHVPLEPRAALAEWDGQKMTVYTGTQRPFGVRSEVARALNLPEDQVRVIVPDTGSGYGGKHTGDAAVEAARIAKAVGKPVRLVWTREEEFTFAYFRPAGIVDVGAKLNADGTLASWSLTNFASGGAGLDSPYAVSNPAEQYRQGRSPMRTGSYRALASTFNHFARESAMDELAASAKLDPLEFRLRNLKNERLRAVLEKCAETFRWKEGPVRGRGRGIACGTEKGGFVATAVELHVEGSEVRLDRIVTVFECGAVVNPDGCRNQVEGSVLQGLGGALFEEIRFADGKIETDRLSRYRVPRFKDMPREFEVTLLNRPDLPSAGAGEAAIVAVAPAIAQAIFQATGKRLRDLPMRLE